MKPYFIILIILISKIGFGQDDTDNQLINDIIEGAAADTEDEDFDFDAFRESLEIYLSNPLNINQITKAELKEIGILSDLQISSFIGHRNKNGRFLSLYELQAVPGWDLNTIYALLPFIKSSTRLEYFNVKAGTLLSKGKHQLIGRYSQLLEKQEGYNVPEEEGKQYYLGQPYKLFLRYRYNYLRKIQYGITAEKDAGEEFFKGSNSTGFDFYSAHFFLRDVKFFKSIAVGDYEAKLGQGLVIWSGFGFGKSPDVMNVMKTGSKLKPYSSVNESLFLRGGGVTIEESGVEVSVFGSFKKVDGNIALVDTFTDNIQSVSSFRIDGFHRTENEIEDERSAKQAVLGGNVSYNKENYHVGINALHTRFDVILDRNLSVYNQFDFEGKQLTNGSIDYHFQWKNLNFFGEGAISDNSGFAVLSGALVSLHPKAQMSVVYRNFQKDYQSLMSNAFSEVSRAVNEEGIYLGLNLQPSRKVNIRGYFDYYKFPWLRFAVDAPSDGIDNLLQVTYKPNRQFELYGRVKRETKYGNQVDNNTPLDIIQPETKTNYRVNVKYSITKALKMKSRIDVVTFNEGDQDQESGFLLFQDVSYSKLGFPLSGSARFAIFDTDGFDTRIYAYENDVLYSYSIPAYFDKGSRLYLVLKARLGRNLDLWFRFAQTWYSNRTSIGSGLTETQGNKRSEIKAQFRLKF